MGEPRTPTRAVARQRQLPVAGAPASHRRAVRVL